MITCSTERYTKKSGSAPLSAEQAKKLLEFAEQTASATGAQYARAAANYHEESLDSSEAQEAIDTIAQLKKEGHDPASYYLLYSSDLLSPSRLWPKDRGQPPSKGAGLPGEGYIAYTPLDLAMGADYFNQFLLHGDYCGLSRDMCRDYFSHQKCHDVAQRFLQILGPGWAARFVSNRRGWLTVICKARNTSMVEFAFVVKGQGVIEGVKPDSFVGYAAQGTQFFDVMDNDSNRVRMGSDIRGHVWQYP